MITQLFEEKPQADDWPREVELILSALEAGGAPEERRRVRRMRYQVKAELKLFSDAPTSEPWTLYTRDVNPKGLGFLTRHRLPLGYGGRLQLPGPHGQFVTIHCTLVRCRETSHGWFEGALYFNREQWTFARLPVHCQAS